MPKTVKRIAQRNHHEGEKRCGSGVAAVQRRYASIMPPLLGSFEGGGGEGERSGRALCLRPRVQVMLRAERKRKRGKGCETVI
jgi:hypothetical protein